jgi:small-conductance mechanosensitive channel
VRLCAIAALVFALSASAQNPLTQLVTGKPNPAQEKSKGAGPGPSTALPSAAPDSGPSATPQVIPLPEVAAQSEQLAQTLSDLSSKLPGDDQLKALNDAINEQALTLDAKRKEAGALLADAPTSMELREQENYWRSFQVFSAEWRKQLLDWANSAQSAVDQLNELEPKWAATLAAYHKTRELEPVEQLVSTNLDSLRKLRDRATADLKFEVKMQIALGAQDQAADEVLARLGVAQQVFAEKLFHRDSLPFWQWGERRQQGENVNIYSTARSRWRSIGAFVSERRQLVAFLAVILVLSLLAAFRLKQACQDAKPDDPESAEALQIVRRWVALGLLAPLLVAYILAPSAPFSLIGLAVLFSFFPILRLLAPLLQPRYRTMLYVLAGYYGAGIVIGWLAISPMLKRELGLATTLGLFFTFLYLLRPARRGPDAAGWRHSLLLFGARVATFAVGISAIANLLGYVRLAQYLGVACVFSTFVGISLYTGLRVYTILLRAALNLPQAERLAAARLHRNALLRWIPRVLATLAFFVWLSATLDLLRVRDEVAGWVQALLDFHIAGSASSITLGRVLGFFLMLAVGYIVATTVRFVLREEVLKRWHLARGLPDLIASVVYYLLLLLVFFTAVNAGGIELNKFTLLTGALGVGFGFGMQNIINNFVSGLILQFERPIHLNDVLEVEGYTGKVTRIGIRSSTLASFQGAEVIIPNANFISGKVVNWTLSEQRRRAELALGVAYGTDPKIVLATLLESANKHELVLTDPQPMAYFTGFGDSSLNFELHFWVMQDSNWYRVRSEIAMAVMKTLEQLGIEIPFPQRDLHLRTVEGEPVMPDTSRLPPSASNANEDGSGTDVRRKRAAVERD